MEAVENEFLFIDTNNVCDEICSVYLTFHFVINNIELI